MSDLTAGSCERESEGISVFFFKTREKDLYGEVLEDYIVDASTCAVVKGLHVS